MYVFVSFFYHVTFIYIVVTEVTVDKDIRKLWRKQGARRDMESECRHFDLHWIVKSCEKYRNRIYETDIYVLTPVLLLRKLGHQHKNYSLWAKWHFVTQSHA